MAPADGYALALEVGGEAVDTASLLHVCMSIPEAQLLMNEAWRVAEPGGVLGVQDVMRRAEALPDPLRGTPSRRGLSHPAALRFPTWTGEFSRQRGRVALREA